MNSVNCSQRRFHYQKGDPFSNRQIWDHMHFAKFLKIFVLEFENLFLIRIHVEDFNEAKIRPSTCICVHVYTLIFLL